MQPHVVRSLSLIHIFMHQLKRPPLKVLRTVRFHRSGGALQQFLRIPHQRQDARTRHGLDPPDTRSHRRLTEDMEQAEFTRIVHMGAAAELHGGLPHPDHPDHIHVFFTKQRHSALAARLVDRHFPDVNRQRFEDPGIHLIFDSGQLFGIESGKMGEIKPQPLAANELSGLLNMGAKYKACLLYTSGDPLQKGV